MRAARSLSTRVASVGAAVALVAAGLAGVAAVAVPAGPAGADTSVGTTTCALSAPAGTTPISASVSAAISPTPVPAGNNFSVTGLALHTTLVSNATTTLGAGDVLSVVYTTNLVATGATPANQNVTFTGTVTLPKPFPIGATAPFSLGGSTGVYTADASGAATTTVSINPAGNLSVTLGAIQFSGTCSGPPPVVIASAPITPAPAFVNTLIPSSGPMVGGTTVKIVGSHFGGVTSVKFGSTEAASFRILSPSLLEAVSPATTLNGNTTGTSDIIVTTGAGPSKAQPLDTYTYVDTTLGTVIDRVSPAVGTSAGGTPVTITGAGFAGGPGQPNCDQTNSVTSVSFGSVNQPNFTVQSDSVITTTAPPGSGLVNVTVVGCDQFTPSPTSSQDQYNYNPGYVLTGSDGGIFSYGQIPGHAGFFGSAGNLHLNKPVVGVAATPNGNGYWQDASDGGVFSYGGAGFYGSAGNLTLNAPVVGMASTPDGAGYWLVAADGGVFTYGDALFYGSAGNLRLNAPIVGIASTPDGGGYWLVAADGGVFAYGDAGFYGSAGGTALNAPITGIASTPGGGGYWFVAADGGVFAYGGAGFYGSLAGTVASPVSGIAGTADGGGYWLVTQGGAVFNRGDAGFNGDRAGFALNGPMVGIAPIQ
ncbi:MAG TPA: IPT/TIG domain-containing protein [Acidimicrobiales bacterium]